MLASASSFIADSFISGHTTEMKTVIAAFFVGTIVGITGMGGGALMTPALIFLGVGDASAVVTADLTSAAVYKSAGAIVHWREGSPNLRLAGWLILGSVPFAFLGPFLLRAVAPGDDIDTTLKRCIGLALLLAASTYAMRLYIQLTGSWGPTGAVVREPVIRPIPTIIVGAVGGLLVGITSVGSGSVIMIALLMLYPTLSAVSLVGTDLVQAVPLVFSAAVSNIIVNGLDWTILIPLIIGSVPGSILGSTIAPRVPSSFIRRGIVVVLVVSGLALLDKSGWWPLGYHARCHQPPDQHRSGGGRDPVRPPLRLGFAAPPGRACPCSATRPLPRSRRQPARRLPNGPPAPPARPPRRGSRWPSGWRPGRVRPPRRRRLPSARPRRLPPDRTPRPATYPTFRRRTARGEVSRTPRSGEFHAAPAAPGHRSPSRSAVWRAPLCVCDMVLDGHDEPVRLSRSPAPEEFSGMTVHADYRLSQLDELEAESIHIFREVAAEFEKPVLMFSGGKDSIVMMRLAEKAFFPAKIPFPVLQVDTGFDFPEVLECRDSWVSRLGVRLVVASVSDAIANGVIVDDGKTSRNRMQTGTLLNAIEEEGFTAAFGGGRRDEEKARSKERVYSHRDEFGQWDPKNQRPELWSLYNGRIHAGEHMRIFPLSNWTELDIWYYIGQEKIEIPADLLLPRARGGQARRHVDVGRLSSTRCGPARSTELKTVRFRTVGDMTLTGCVESDASTVDQIIDEIAVARVTERGATRGDDRFSEAAMEDRKREGYF